MMRKNRLVQANPSKMWDATGYTRVSKDGRDRDESNSIKTQRDMILDFAERNPDINVVSLAVCQGLFHRLNAKTPIK